MSLLCGHVWVAGLEALRTLSPAGLPHPEVNLLLSRHLPEIFEPSQQLDLLEAIADERRQQFRIRIHAARARRTVLRHPWRAATGLRRVHGLHLMVVAHKGVEYVPAKPFAKLACIDWKSARRTLFNEENVVLYGTRVISTPKIWGAGGDITPQEGVFLRLDRARMFLARINTSRMRAQGNSLGADQLLALQIEWARVLHQYETTGEARKTHRKSAISEVRALQRARDATGNQAERDALTCLLHATMAELDAPVIEPENPQAALPLAGGVS